MGALWEVLMEAAFNGTVGQLTAGKADAWRQRIEARRASGQSVRAWCGANGIREHSFYWWRKRLGLSPRKRRPSKPVEAKPAPPAFARVVVQPSTVEPLRFRLAGGRELVLPASMDLSRVAELIAAVERAVALGPKA
jgi:hypothetical protein